MTETLAELIDRRAREVQAHWQKYEGLAQRFDIRFTVSVGQWGGYTVEKWQEWWDNDRHMNQLGNEYWDDFGWGSWPSKARRYPSLSISEACCLLKHLVVRDILGYGESDVVARAVDELDP